MKERLYECAKVLCSRNSGPFEIALDCLFDGEQVYWEIKESGIINHALVVELYYTPEDLVTNIVLFDPAPGLKIILAR